MAMAPALVFPSIQNRILVGAFFSGFLTLLLEVAFLRQISMGTDNTVYAFGSAMLIMLLLMFAVSFAIAILPDHIAESALLLPAILAFSSIGLLVSVGLFAHSTDGLKTVIMDHTLGPVESFSFSLGFLPMGLLFPVAFSPCLSGSSEAPDGFPRAGYSALMGWDAPWERLRADLSFPASWGFGACSLCVFYFTRFCPLFFGSATPSSRF
jgi:hypothetical protein